MSPMDENRDFEDYGKESLKYGDKAAKLPNELIIPGLSSGKDPKKAKERAASSGYFVVVVADGYPNIYQSDSDEIAAANAGLHLWMPSSIDFLQTALRATGGNEENILKVASEKEFFEKLANFKGNIQRLMIIAHGTKGGIGFSGTEFEGSKSYLNIDVLNKKDNLDKVKKIKAKLLANSRIDLVACNSGADPNFSQAFKITFGVTVYGFNVPVNWILRWSVDKETKEKSIIPAEHRGLVFLVTNSKNKPIIYFDPKKMPFRKL